MFIVKAHPRLHWEHGDKLVWGALVLVTLEAGEENCEKYVDLVWPAFDEQLSFYGKDHWIDNDESRIRLKDDGDAHRLVECLYRQVLEEAGYDMTIESVQP